VSHYKKVSVLYTQGFWDGELGSDVLKFAPLLTPQVRCDIAAIKTSHNFYMNGSHWQVQHVEMKGIPMTSICSQRGFLLLAHMDFYEIY
jgi:hypothetical protein